MLWVGLQCVIVAFPGHTHLLFGEEQTLGSGPYLRMCTKKNCSYFSTKTYVEPPQ